MFGGDSERRAREKQRQLESLSSYLKQQIAQKLDKLQEDRARDLREERATIDREMRNKTPADDQESHIQAKII